MYRGLSPPPFPTSYCANATAAAASLFFLFIFYSLRMTCHRAHYSSAAGGAQPREKLKSDAHTLHDYRHRQHTKKKRKKKRKKKNKGPFYGDCKVLLPPPPPPLIICSQVIYVWWWWWWKHPPWRRCTAQHIWTATFKREKQQQWFNEDDEKTLLAPGKHTHTRVMQEQLVGITIA